MLYPSMTPPIEIDGIGRLLVRTAIAVFRGECCVAFRRRREAWHAMVIALLCVGSSTDASAQEQRVPSAQQAGVVEGRVIYHRDGTRPWRYSRYYVKKPKSGELAEAVVAIRGKGLSLAKSAASAETKIDQKNFQFQPETIAVRTGDSVTFTNSDRAAHNVRSSGASANFNITMPVDGKGYTARFDRAGGIGRPVEVDCVFHSNMRAWIFVFDHPYFMITPADGRFRLADVPAGKYELEVAHPAGRLRWRKPIEVKAGETLQVDIKVSPDNLK